MYNSCLLLRSSAIFEQMYSSLVVEHPMSDNNKGEVIGGTLGGFAAGILVTLGATYLMRRRRG